MGGNMLLRNKKTGEIGSLLGLKVSAGIIWVNIEFLGREPKAYCYNSLAELNDEWEDYEPVEPIIEDEKARNVFREWAEINDIKTVLVCESFNSWGFKNKNNSDPGDKEYMGADLLFRGKKPEKLEFGKEYTIPELCGEEEK